MVARLISDAEKTRWVVLLMAAWLLLGLLGHDPWKPDEAYTFGVVWRMLEHGQWLIPNIAGQPFDAHFPPLFYWSAALFAKVFGVFVPLHDAARLVSAAWIALALWGIGLSARELYGKGSGRYAVLAFAGCIGLLERTHLLVVDNALLAALAFVAYALLRARREGRFTAPLLGVSIAAAFLSKGILGGVLACALLAAFAWAGATLSAPERARVQKTTFIALAISVAIIGLWAVVVGSTSPGVLGAWWQQISSAWLEALSPVRMAKTFWQHIVNLLWFAFPALPLALWSARLAQRGFIGGTSRVSFRLTVAAFFSMWFVLVLATDARATDLMPLLIPLALLAVPGLDHLKRGHSGLLDWLGIFFFGAVILFAWAYWSALYFGVPRGLVKSQNNFQPGFKEAVRILPATLAFVLTVVWFAMIRPARRTHKRALVNWTVGLTAVWGVGMLLMMPYLDYGKSYRIPVREVVSRLPEDVRSGRACVSSIGLGAAQRAMFDYLANVQTQPADARTPIACAWVLQQANENNKVKLPVPSAQFERVWSGTRPGGKDEPWQLYRRRTP